MQNPRIVWYAPVSRLAMNSLDQFFDLAPTERAKHYRQLADEMWLRADSATTEQTRLGYLDMAADWLDLAQKLEAEYGKVSVVVDAPELAALLRRTSS